MTTTENLPARRTYAAVAVREPADPSAQEPPKRGLGLAGWLLIVVLSVLLAGLLSSLSP